MSALLLFFPLWEVPMCPLIVPGPSFCPSVSGCGGCVLFCNLHIIADLVESLPLASLSLSLSLHIYSLFLRYYTSTSCLHTFTEDP